MKYTQEKINSMIETIKSEDKNATVKVVKATYKGREYISTEIKTKLATSSNNKFGLDCDSVNNTFIMLLR